MSCLLTLLTNFSWKVATKPDGERRRGGHPACQKVWCNGHVLMTDHRLLPATHTFIHIWNEPYCLYSPAAKHHCISCPM